MVGFAIAAVATDRFAAGGATGVATQTTRVPQAMQMTFASGCKHLQTAAMPAQSAYRSTIASGVVNSAGERIDIADPATATVAAMGKQSGAATTA
jgi:hypothetical protein